MPTSLGLVGLPNAGKTTVFNALTAAGAPAQSYPFCTIERNVAVVPVPDPRLEALAERLWPEEVKPTTIEVIDIAGLVRGAHAGEGLGNRFLDDIRGVDALFHVVRCFEAPSVPRAGGSSSPVEDLRLVDTELMLADLAIAERRFEQLAKKAKAGGGCPKELEAFRAIVEGLRAGSPLALSELPQEVRAEVASARFLTMKPSIVVANTDEGTMEHEAWDALVRAAAPRRVIPFAGALEADLAAMAPEDREALRRELGLGESRVEELVRAGFELLGLITFYTVARNKLHAWRIRRGATALEAAALIHSQIAEGFIRADVFRADDLREAGSVAALRMGGKVRSEGRDYEIQDGEVLYVHFHS